MNTKELDLTKITSERELQTTIMQKLDFPEFYGKNWDAFWDTITGLVELPDCIIIKGWDDLVNRLPKEADTLKKILDEYNEEYPMFKCNIEYK